MNIKLNEHDKKVLKRIKEIIHELEEHDLKVVMYNAYIECIEGEWSIMKRYKLFLYCLVSFVTGFMYCYIFHYLKISYLLYKLSL